jgi:hypothetical protein
MPRVEYTKVSTASQNLDLPAAALPAMAAAHSPFDQLNCWGYRQKRRLAARQSLLKRLRMAESFLKISAVLR